MSELSLVFPNRWQELSFHYLNDITINNNHLFMHYLLHYVTTNNQNSLCTATDPLWSYLCVLSFSSFPLLISGQSQHRSHQKVQLLCLRFQKRLSEISLFLVSLCIWSYCSSFRSKLMVATILLSMMENLYQCRCI